VLLLLLLLFMLNSCQHAVYVINSSQHIINAVSNFLQQLINVQSMLCEWQVVAWQLSGQSNLSGAAIQMLLDETLPSHAVSTLHSSCCRVMWVLQLICSCPTAWWNEGRPVTSEHS
jgi:hypothetical protein